MIQTNNHAKTTFSDIVKAVCKAYNVDACYIADNIGIEDEVVEEWIKGTRTPTHHELEHFSSAFVIPMKTLEDSLK
jgi:transcriptional regulator with XRE-family HTH domain